MRYYSIGEFAEKIGKAIQTLRNWDKNNTFKPAYVTAAGTRYYSQEQLNNFLGLKIKTKIKDKKALIEKVGWIKINEQIPSDIKYSNPRITYDNKYWYISVGIDLAICSNGQVFKNINKTIKVRKLEKRLKQKHRQISRKYEMNKIKKEGGVRCQFIKTKNIEKLENTTKLIHRKLTNIRNNYLHQVTLSIVKTKPYRIVIEDLNVSGMMKNKHLSDSVRKQCFNKFRQYLTYKTELCGIELVIVDRFYPSSKTCSICGSIKHDLKLKDRIYKCSHCGAIIDRDYNASLNLSMYKLA